MSGLRRLLTLGAVAGVIACGASETREQAQDREEMAPRPIEEVLADHTDGWMELRGVVGTSIGECDGAPCIRVMVVKKTDELAAKIPAKVEGYSVDVVETGRIEARDTG
jgi:hypothetical protein